MIFTRFKFLKTIKTGKGIKKLQKTFRVSPTKGSKLFVKNPNKEFTIKTSILKKGKRIYNLFIKVF